MPKKPVAGAMQSNAAAEHTTSFRFKRPPSVDPYLRLVCCPAVPETGTFARVFSGALRESGNRKSFIDSEKPFCCCSSTFRCFDFTSGELASGFDEHPANSSAKIQTLYFIGVPRPH